MNIKWLLIDFSQESPMIYDISCRLELKAISLSIEQARNDIRKVE